MNARKTRIVKGGLKQERTRQKLLDAFDTVLRRDGVQKLGINSVLREASVGKSALYNYFGGIKGLAEAWARSHAVEPSKDDMLRNEGRSSRQPAHEQIKQVNRNYAHILRNSAISLELLKEELLHPTSFSDSMQAIRKRIGKVHEEIFTNDERYADPDLIALIFILQAAINYLAMRSSASPNFNGVMLDTDQGWEQILDMIDRVCDKFE